MEISKKLIYLISIIAALILLIVGISMKKKIADLRLEIQEMNSSDLVDSLNNQNKALREQIIIFDDSISEINEVITDKQKSILSLKKELYIINKKNEEIDTITFDHDESWDIFSRFTDL
jgi:peptidoglycan hydrolase CwlO-like protein